MSSSTSEATEASSSHFLTRVQNFLSENKKAVIISTAVVVLAIGGAAYYVSTSRSTLDTDVDLEKSEKKKDKKKTKGKKRKSVKDRDGPLLEERKPKKDETGVPSVDEVKLSAAEIEALSTEERTNRAAALKASGNAAYAQRNFADAVEFYTRALEVSPKPEAVFYSNRAACKIAH